MSNYFIMDNVPWSDTQKGYMEIEDWARDVKGFEDWSVGRPASKRPVEPVEIRAVPHDGYVGLPDDFFDSNVPLMSRRVKEALDGAGVDNVTYLPVTLRNPETGEGYEYYAFNLVGLVSATDFASSNIASPDGGFVGDSEIHDLVIDESKCKGFLMFRLKEKFSAVFVHRKVKEGIERRGITTLKFTKPEAYMHL